MSANELANESGGGVVSESSEGDLDPVDFDALAAEVLEGTRLGLIESSSGWSAIVLPVSMMPGDMVSSSLGTMFQGAERGGVSFEAIRASLSLLKLAIIESSETEGGARLEELGFGEWMELLEGWTSGG
jgi:hypothetical protein